MGGEPEFRPHITIIDLKMKLQIALFSKLRPFNAIAQTKTSQLCAIYTIIYFCTVAYEKHEIIIKNGKVYVIPNRVLK